MRRATSGAADAHCPHMGAHLGHGGRWVGPAPSRARSTAGASARTAERVVGAGGGPARQPSTSTRRAARATAWYVFLGHEDGSRPDPWPLADLRRPEDDAPDHLEVLEVDLPAHQQLVVEGEFDAGHFPLLHDRPVEGRGVESFDGTRASARYLVHEPMAQEIEVELDGVSRMRLEVALGRPPTSSSRATT